ncbi:MAG: FdhF/YdeP family oxidoreductase [Mucilaginibacter polytrichastri]|nr:FdhF/YdeP family oxidoreductase [Mucilaginibacter polytrichastri]
MKKQRQKKVSAENPEQLLDLKLGKPKKWAAGMPAVWESMKDITRESGFGRGMKGLLRMNQKNGFDCPGCAWPDPDDDRSPVAEYCENGAKALAEEATTKKLDADFFAKNSVAELSGWNDLEIGKSGRIAEPFYLAPGATHYRPVSWDGAFQKIGDKLNTLASPDEAAFYTSGRTSNEAAFLFQLFAREFGTNNLPDCSNMCHESTSVALAETIGIGKGTVTLEDFYRAEVIMILGQNPGTNHPRMLTALEKAKQNGAKIIAINPLKEAGLLAFENPQTPKGIMGISTKLADLYLQVKINGDLALLKGIIRFLYDAEKAAPGTVFDPEFIATKTDGYADFLAQIERYSLDELVAHSGITQTGMRLAAEMLRDKKKIIICWAMGITQHKNGVDTINEIVNLTLLKGSIGKPGAGLCPTRGHSNVQGDRTMLIWDKPKPEQLDKLKEVFGFEPPRKNGYDVVESIKAMHEGKLKVLFAMGGNFLSATPDTVYTAVALEKLEMSVHVSTKLNRSHLVHGHEAFILPCLSRSDQDMAGDDHRFVTCENSMGVVQMSKGNLKPISADFLSEPDIVCRLAKATLGEKTVIKWDRYKDYDAIRDDIGKTIPGHEDYNDRVRHPGGFYIPNAARECEFKTNTKKAHFTVNNLPVAEVLGEAEFRMTTIRSHDQYNTTLYGLDDRYRGIDGERRVVLMNEDDMARAGFVKGEKVDLFNHHGGIERVARLFLIVPYDIPDGCIATYYPETNVLVPIDSVAEKSNTPTSKMVMVSIKKHLQKELARA